MSLMTGICFLLRFYKGSVSWKDVWERMTIRHFNVMFNEITNLLEIEFGDNENKEKSKPVSLTGKKGFELAKRLFPKGKVCPR